MAERATAELLQPALLDRLTDTIRLIDHELARLRRATAPIVAGLQPAGREALAGLVHPDRRPIRAPSKAELAPFASLGPEAQDLLLRLIEEEHRRQIEVGQRYALSRERLKQLVLRDLERLLNTERLAAQASPGEGPADSPVGALETEFPRVAASVVNYGMPPLAGRLVRGLDLDNIAEEVATAIRRFEPRLRADSVEVRATLDPETMQRNTLELEIDADLWAVPLPVHLRLRTEIDLESGSARIIEKAA